MNFNLSIPAQPPEARSYGFVKNFYKGTTAFGYGVNSTRGYTITSKQSIDSSENDKIKEILGAFVNAKINRENSRIANKYSHYKCPLDDSFGSNAKELFSTAQNNLQEVQQKYGIISIEETNENRWY
jgi:hypothetical protein